MNVLEHGDRRRPPPHRRTRSARGAAAVELALVSTILFTLLFAIVDYGLWFNDSLNTRQGVREGARRAVVENFTVPSGSPCAAAAGRREDGLHRPAAGQPDRRRRLRPRRGARPAGSAATRSWSAA